MKKKLCIFAVFLITSLHAIPDFLIIGVTKCGTTSLYDYLIQHPKILGAKKRELAFFNSDNKYKKGIRYYNNQFPKKKLSSQLVGEATPWYFWRQQCLPRIAQCCSKTKIILILRNPVKRAISHYFFFNREKFSRLWFNLSFEKAISQSFNWSQSIIDQGFYYKNLKRWFQYFPKEQIHIVILEDLVANPELEVNKVFNFLGLDNYKLASYAPENTGSYKNGSVTPESIQMLEELYKPHNKMLEEFLGRKLPWDIQLTKRALDFLDDEAFV